MSVSLEEFIAMMRTETNKKKRRREQLMFDVATFVVGRAKHHARLNFTGRNPANRRTGALMRSIALARIENHFMVTAGGSGVPYAMVHELGTMGKGGSLQSIRSSRPGGALTVPLLPQYVGKRAREFDLHVVKPKDSKFAFLGDSKGKLAYLLLKRVDIEPRPYLEPAVKEINKSRYLMARIRLLFGSSKLPYTIVQK